MSEDDKGSIAKELDAVRRKLADAEQREAALKTQLALHTEIQDHLPDLISVKDDSLRFVYANKAFREFHGKTLEQIVGTTESALESAELAERHREHDRNVLSSGIFVNISSELLQRHDGRVAHFHTVRSPVRVAGKVSRVLTCSRGIQTDASVSAGGSHQSAAHNQLLLSIIPDMYFRIGRDGTYLDFAAAKGTDTALPPAYFLGKKMEDVTPDLAPSVMASAHAALRTGAMQTLEFKMYIQGAMVDYEARILVSGPDEVLAIVRDISPQKQVEQQLREAQEDVIRMQMIELSTPLIPISDRVMVMPIIGTLDERRTQQMMERLLSGVAQHRAAVTILDVTGMSSVTTQAASALIQCAKAVRLLGARVLLTGISPDVAQTLVTLEVDLSDIVTLSTLKAGIAYAMKM
jgi:rsbT co-antagonist protein RsbR